MLIRYKVLSAAGLEKDGLFYSTACSASVPPRMSPGGLFCGRIGCRPISVPAFSDPALYPRPSVRVGAFWIPFDRVSLGSWWIATDHGSLTRPHPSARQVCVAESGIMSGRVHRFGECMTDDLQLVARKVVAPSRAQERAEADAPCRFNRSRTGFPSASLSGSPLDRS